MTDREEAITVLKAFMENPLFSEVHKAVFNIAIHDIKAYQDWNINNLILVNKDNYEPIEQESTTKNDVPDINVGKIGSTTKNDDLALIHTFGLDEEIRCTMCTNYMKSDRGCDGSCVVDKDMYKAVMDAIEKRIQPTTKNDLAVDAISRAEVLKLMQDNWHTHNGDWAMEESMDDIRALQAVTPIRPKGHWIPIYQGDEIIDYRCSECEFGNTFGKGTIGMNFCPRCGSDNREVEE